MCWDFLRQVQISPFSSGRVTSRLGMPTLTFLRYFYRPAYTACEAARKKSIKRLVIYAREQSICKKTLLGFQISLTKLQQKDHVHDSVESDKRSRKWWNTMNVCVEEQTKIKFNVLFNKFDILSCLDHSDGIRVGVTVLFMSQQRKNLIFLVFAHFTTTPKWHVLTLLKQFKKNATALVIDRLTSRTPPFSRAVLTPPAVIDFTTPRTRWMLRKAH